MPKNGLPKEEAGTADQSSGLGFSGDGNTDNQAAEKEGELQDQQNNSADKKNQPEQPSGKAINLFRFMQLQPQSSGIKALLVSKYKGEAKTEQEWEETIKSLLAQKAK